MKSIREGHIATEVEEVTEYLRCFAVPLTAKGKTIAAISINMPTFRATEDKIRLATDLLLSGKEKIDSYFLTINVDSIAYN